MILVSTSLNFNNINTKTWTIHVCVTLWTIMWSFRTWNMWNADFTLEWFFLATVMFCFFLLWGSISQLIYKRFEIPFYIIYMRYYYNCTNRTDFNHDIHVVHANLIQIITSKQCSVRKYTYHQIGNPLFYFQPYFSIHAEILYGHDEHS